MKDAATMKGKQEEMNKIRRWILKSISKATPETAVTLYSIKKFLDSKQNGLSINPETKLVMKRLTESGHLVKIDGKYFDGKNSPKDKQSPAQKSKNGSELKNLAKGSVTPSAEKSSTQEAVGKESETVGLDMKTQ
ncbi:hypothetical protein AVEN_168085-1 [Araneus ventricosus]|uniref:H15 domain-containing protein n=1 Tax=Araneus ventricosus TaxID=182803 RepID=A0A4Y2MW27_ARAVE|nr:hypothetical protein AVEN_168085-1 [Araneus ventricosus]